MTTPVVICAGGRGLRLHPLTEKVPKPMLPVGDKPMLQTMVERLVRQGFTKIWMTVHYRHEVIERHFGDGSRFGANIHYVIEREPLGTGGGLKYLPAWSSPFIVVNADVDAPDLHFAEILETHAAAKAQATIGLALYQHQVPYGVARVNSRGAIRRIDEKPIENFYVLGGIYALEPALVKQAPEGRWDITDLLARAKPLAAWPIHTQWRDLGSFEDLTEARAKWNGKNGKGKDG